MSAERDKSILIGTGIFLAGVTTGVAAIIWLLNRDVPDKHLNPEDHPDPSPEG